MPIKVIIYPGVKGVIFLSIIPMIIPVNLTPRELMGNNVRWINPHAPE